MDEIININNLIDYVIRVNAEFKGQVWWRGQEKKGWSLVPKVFRKSQLQKHEKSRIQRFQKRAGVRHSNVPNQDDKCGWLFLMQHYGLPTRLLDWTESPLIACYFSTLESKNHNPEEGELFALSPYSLNEVYTGNRILLMPENRVPKEIIDNAYNGKSDVEKIIAIRPYEVDIRMMVQVSEFTIHGSEKPLDEINDSEKFLKRIIIPASSKKNLQEGLKQLGIRESILFPDLNHLAKEIENTKFKSIHTNNVKKKEPAFRGLNTTGSGEIEFSEPST